MLRTPARNRRPRTTAPSPGATAPPAPNSTICTSSSPCSTGPAPTCPNRSPRLSRNRKKSRTPPPAVKPDYDGSEDEFHYGGEAYVGSQETPEFRAWLEDMERRFGPVPIDDGRPGSLNECSVSGRTFIGKLMTPEFRAWRERQHRRTEESLARCLDRAGKP